MKCVCKFNKGCDYQATASGLALDLGTAMKKGAVPASLGSSEFSFNGISNPENILGRPKDIFDSMRMEKETYNAAKASSAAKKAAKEAAAAAEPSPGEPGAPGTSQE